MSEYMKRKYDATHVTVTLPDGEAMNSGHPLPIILDLGGRVWVSGSYGHLRENGDKRHPLILQVGDGETNGFDEDGNCILSVPSDWCKFLDEGEARDLDEMIGIAQELLSYAR